MEHSHCLVVIKEKPGWPFEIGQQLTQVTQSLGSTASRPRPTSKCSINKPTDALSNNAFPVLLTGLRQTVLFSSKLRSEDPDKSLDNLFLL